MISNVTCGRNECQKPDRRRIASAITQAQPGDTIRLPEGTFGLVEPIRPKSGTKLIGAGQEKTRLAYPRWPTKDAEGTKTYVTICQSKGINRFQALFSPQGVLDREPWKQFLLALPKVGGKQ